MRQSLTAAVGDIDAVGFPERFRDEPRNLLSAERGAGATAAEVTSGKGGKSDAERVLRAARELPASWVVQGNVLPLTAIKGSDRGLYR